MELNDQDLTGGKLPYIGPPGVVTASTKEHIRFGIRHASSSGKGVSIKTRVFNIKNEVYLEQSCLQG